ncbi:MAG: O-antigen ligase family protein [Acidobacteria bacterium]|nr:O-antigen ligase family protein [Acidobacteriota bacterium]
MINEIAYTQPDAGTQRIEKITQPIIAFTLLMYVLFAPHSIAVTQGACVLGLLVWTVEMVATRKFRQRRTPIDLAILGFFAWCILSSFFSYEFQTSLKGVKSPAFFLAFYFISANIKSLRFARFLIFALIVSCLVNVAYSAGQIAIGRGLHIDQIEAGSPFDKEGLQQGDVILEADDQKVKTLDELSRIADSQRGRMLILYQRNEALGEASISRKAIRQSPEEGVARLGIAVSPGRSFRISGFYSHYETYAEVLQLIAAVVCGLLMALPHKRSWQALLLALSGLLIIGALILTSTRAALAGMALAITVMAFASARKQIFALAILGIVLLAPLAYVVVKHSRGDKIFTPQEDSAQYRLEVWREAFWLIRDHPLTGIGKGSEGGAYLREKYALYNGGKLPPGHFHSTIVQIATWWGLPALAMYAAMMAIFFREIWRLNRRLRERKNWNDWGIVLGVMGALVAFNVSSLVHFNFGDGEVVMMFWLLTGIVFAIRHQLNDEERAEQTDNKTALPTPTGSHKNQLQEQEANAEANVRVAVVSQNSPAQ